MHLFELASPKTREQAVKLRGTDPSQATFLAGGSDLLGLMKDRIETPSRVVFLKSVGGLVGVRSEKSGGKLRLGALSTVDDLSADAALGFDYPAITAAAGRVAGPQIRNVATLGGNLLQRPAAGTSATASACWPSATASRWWWTATIAITPSWANDGPAYFVQPSTLAPLFIAAGAQVVLFGPQGERWLDLEKLYRIPKAEGEREHDLRPGEMLTEVVLPAASGRRLASYEVRQRQTLDWSLATAAVSLEMDGGTVMKARVILGQVAPVPWAATEAEEFLKGKTMDLDVAAKAGDAAVAKAKPSRRTSTRFSSRGWP